MMDEQELEAALSLLMKQIEGEPGDLREIYQQLTQVLNGMRAFGMPLPEDLVRLEKELEEEFRGESGRGKGKPRRH
jgi:predicted unusual protein kinase regulating ubiquinone biosynthesis (AarF/ABC1/UbiB family)